MKIVYTIENIEKLLEGDLQKNFEVLGLDKMIDEKLGHKIGISWIHKEGSEFNKYSSTVELQVYERY